MKKLTKNENILVYKCDSSALKEEFLAGAAAMLEKVKKHDNTLLLR